jgi:hypothetical protein
MHRAAVLASARTRSQLCSSARFLGALVRNCEIVEMTTPRKLENLREICGTNLYALWCSLVRNEYNGRCATMSIQSVS